MLEFILTFIFLCLLLIAGQFYYHKREKNKTSEQDNEHKISWTEYTSKGKTTYTLENNRVSRNIEKTKYKPKK